MLSSGDTVQVLEDHDQLLGYSPSDLYISVSQKYPVHTKNNKKSL